jgi:predicted alpha/beta hydrolase family esterase
MVLKENFSIFFIIVPNFINFLESNNCNCTKISHEEHFCDSDFFMKVFVQSFEDKDENDIIYSVDFIKIFEKNNGKNRVQVQNTGHLNEKQNHMKNQFF